MSRYFENFPTAQYNNAICRNIIQRTALSKEVLNVTAAFYPYQAKEGERPDTLSHLYYNDSSLEWLVFFANDIVDPYYGWYLDGNQFNQYIVSKYGSLAEAQLKVHHYQVDWASDDRRLTISAYEALYSVAPVNLKKYWQPVTNDYGAVVFYQRAPLELTSNTNKIIKLVVGDTAGFEVGELVSQLSGDTVIGYGEIISINDSTSMTLQHINGGFVVGTTITGFSSGSSTSPVTITNLKENIPSVEQTYWRAISFYDYEEYLNERRKALKLVDSRFTEQAQRDLKMLMAG